MPKLSTSSLSRRQFVKGVGLTTATLAFMPHQVFAKEPRTMNADRNVYVGTYTAPNTAPGGDAPSTAQGIYVYRLDTTGTLHFIQVIDTENPSFLATDPTQGYLYCVNELGENIEGQLLGKASAFAINSLDGTLSYINAQLTQGLYPCHCSVHPSGGFLMAANYGSGSFPIFPLNADGSIGPVSDIGYSTTNGSGPNPDRQEAPHAHMVLSHPSQQHLFGIDLGADRVFSWQLNHDKGTLSSGTVPYANIASGSGPRHMVFHPNEKAAYVINELICTIDVFSFDLVRGALVWQQSVSTLASEESGGAPAEVRVHPNGQWLYATNRQNGDDINENTIGLFNVDAETGKLTPISWIYSEGKVPRGMNIEPSGEYLLVGNQNSDNIAVFTINQQNGELSLTSITPCPTPVDFAFS
ncbi:lactonase family protein [Vibrio sp. BS-M-Sm-2]|uniref:lactonase family protein n=1 Tax=Vibrio sp. BS-M-Sm-2 TaxID=3241167 RepID=UPI003558707D